MEIWSHRLRVRPTDFGNSLAGLRILRQMGVDGVETDISFSKDKEIIIYHPGSLNPDLTTLTWQEITSTRLPVITLQNLLEFIITKPGVKCCLDIKQNSKELVKKAMEIIIWHGLEDEVYLTAFQKRIPALGLESDKKLLVYARSINPQIKTHIIITWPANLPKLVKQYQPDMISLGWLKEPFIIKLISILLFEFVAATTDLTTNLRSQLEEIREKGVKILGGVVNSPDDMTYFAELGVDGIMTDNPYQAMQFFKKI